MSGNQAQQTRASTPWRAIPSPWTMRSEARVSGLCWSAPTGNVTRPVRDSSIAIGYVDVGGDRWCVRHRSEERPEGKRQMPSTAPAVVGPLAS